MMDITPSYLLCGGISARLEVRVLVWWVVPKRNSFFWSLSLFFLFLDDGTMVMETRETKSSSSSEPGEEIKIIFQNKQNKRENQTNVKQQAQVKVAIESF